MSEIPSDIASSAAGAPLQARDAAKVREARRAGQAQAAERQVTSVDEAGSMVDTEDADTQVFADAEGGGGLGRQLGEAEEEGAETVGDASSGVTTDEDGQTHLDLQA